MNITCTNAWAGFKLCGKKRIKAKQSIFAENILSQKSVSHASNKITTEKFKSNYVKLSLLQFMPKFFTNKNMVKIKKQQQDRDA